MSRRGTAIRTIYQEHKKHPFDELWAWARRGKSKRERYRRFRALQHWAAARRNDSSGDEREAWNNRRKAYRKQKRRVLSHIHDDPQPGEVILTPGSPHWGGSEDIIRNEILPIYVKHGVPITSGKRWETFGNPSSDHYMGNTTASARDAGTANNYALRDEVMHALGVSGDINDYSNYYIQRAGATFRVQPIAGTHGTGPHLHIGLRR